MPQAYKGVLSMTKTACAVALGFFDGVHIAHRKIIKAAADYAKEYDLVPVVLTFDKSPLEILRPDAARYLTQNDEKAHLIEKLGARTEFLKTTEQLLNMSAEEFILDILIKKYNIKYAVCGYNYRFGREGSGDTELLKSFGAKYGFKTEIAPPIKSSGESVSSSRIRTLLADGGIREANTLLGRSFCVRGEVHHGKHLGRTLGFPTANVFFDKSCARLKNGVYKTQISIDGAAYKAITNIGINPTVGGESLRSETYIPAFDADLYGKEIKIEFIDFIRPEIKFESIDELKSQIKKDTEIL